MNNKKLLFVEDNMVAAEALKSFLSSRCEDLAVAHSAEDAYKMFLDENHDLVITDLHLPEMNGFGLLQKIKEAKPETIVFIISAHHTPDNTREAKELGAAKFFPKPIDLDMLERAVREALTK